MKREVGRAFRPRVLFWAGLAVAALVVIPAAPAWALGNVSGVSPQPVAPGGDLTVTTDSWEFGAGVNFYWNNDFSAPIATGFASFTGTLTVSFTVPAPLTNGTYEVEACEPSPPPPCGGATPAAHSVVVQNPVTATNDSGSTAASSVLSVAAPGVLANDVGPGIHVIGNTSPAHGDAAVGGDGSYTYTPAPGYSGPDSFGYTISDAGSNTASATVALTVSPVAIDDQFTRDTTTLIVPPSGVLANDLGTGLTVTGHGQASHGTVYVGMTGGFTYTADNGFAGADQFDYAVKDASGALTTASVTISVQSAAPAPVTPTTATTTTTTTSTTTPPSTTTAPSPPERSAAPATPPPVAAAANRAPASTVSSAYDRASEPGKVISIQVAAFTLLALTGAGGLALAGSGGAVGGAVHRDSGAKRGGGVPAAKVQRIGGGSSDEAGGDGSATWRWRGTTSVDRWSLLLPVRIAPRSPLAARLLTDGSYLRAMLGSLSLVAPVTGLLLGVLAVNDVGGHALPPATWLTIGLTVIGVLDAFAGTVAVLTFVIGVTALGGLDSADAGRTMLGLCALWFVIPLLASAARPLRRERAETLGQRWDRGADFVIASLIGAWAVQKIVAGLPALSGQKLPIAADADLAAIVVLGALVVRMLGETLAADLYPARLVMVQPATIPTPGLVQRVSAIVVRTAIFLFVAVVVVGSHWQLWVGAAMFVIPQILSVFETRFPNVPSLYRVLPRRLLKTVLLIFVGRWFGTLVLHATHDSKDAIADAFVLLPLPGLALSVLDLFGREGPEPELSWPYRLAGLALLAIGVLAVLSVIS